MGQTILFFGLLSTHLMVPPLSRGAKAEKEVQDHRGEAKAAKESRLCGVHPPTLERSPSRAAL